MLFRSILGGGVVGLTLALLLARDRLRIALVTPARPAAPASPDIRAYALNLAARQLLESLRVWPESTDGSGPSPVTPVTRMWVSDATANAARAESGSKANVPHAEYVLKGKILEDRSNAGSTRQSSFVFQLTLVEEKRGVAVWTDEKIVTKQGTKNAVGF